MPDSVLPGFLYTYNGKIAFPGGAPTLLDIAIGLSREGRFAGQGVSWWPVILHTFVVCDLLPKRLKIHGLLHDSEESITGDIPKPLKTEAENVLGETIRKSIYRSNKLAYPTAKQWALIKIADHRALCGEVYTVGTRFLQGVYHHDPEVEALCLKYAAEFPPNECLSPDGRAPMEFLSRYNVYRKLRL
jgi:hypothetical protein